MKREWITDTNKMGFTAEELETVNKVIDFTDTILYYNGKDYKTEDPSDTYYYTSKDLLMENINYTYTELEKDGVFEEEEAPADPWLKVLEDRVKKEEEKEANGKEVIADSIAHFKEWLNSRTDAEIVGDIEYRAKEVTKAYECYKAVWHRLGRAKDELAAYKRTMKL